MNKPTPLFAILILGGCLLLGGCASTANNGPQGAYPTLKQTRMMVEPKMSHYRNASAFGALSLGERERVDSAYKSYKKAFDAAVLEAHSNYNATTPENVKTLANEVISAVESISL